VFRIYFTSPYVRLCIATLIATSSSISANHIATSAHLEPALRRQYIQEVPLYSRAVVIRMPEG